MVKKNKELSLDTVAALVLGAPPSLGLEQLEATLESLAKAGATPASKDVPLSCFLLYYLRLDIHLRMYPVRSRYEPRTDPKRISNGP